MTRLEGGRLRIRDAICIAIRFPSRPGGFSAGRARDALTMLQSSASTGESGNRLEHCAPAVEAGWQCILLEGPGRAVNLPAAQARAAQRWLTP